MFLIFSHQWFTQLYALCIKNVLLLIRNWRMTLMILLAPIFFLSLLVLFDHIQAYFPLPYSSYNYGPIAPITEVSSTLSPCIPFNGLPCKTIRYTMVNQSQLQPFSSQSQNMNDLIKNLFSYVFMPNSMERMKNELVYYSSLDDLNDFIQNNPNSTLYGIIFNEISSNQFNYTIMFNASTKLIRNFAPTKFPDGRLEIQSILNKAYLNLFHSKNLSRSLAFQEFSMIYPTQTEKKQRQGLKLIGMRDSTYWASWFIIGSLQGILLSLVILAVGHSFQVIMFTRTLFWVQWLIFFLYCESIIMLAFLTSTFVHKCKSAIIVGILFFLVGIIFCGMGNYREFINLLYKEESTMTKIFKIFAPFNLAKCFSDMITFTNPSYDMIGDIDPFFDWSIFTNSSVTTKVWGDIYTMITILPSTSTSVLFIFMDMILYAALAWYLDNIIPSVNGKPYKWNFFLTKRYWKNLFFKISPSEKAMTGEFFYAKDLTKTFGGFSLWSCIKLPKRKKTSSDVTTSNTADIKEDDNIKSADAPISAVNKVSFFVKESEIFCILGQNGAGKTTLINMLSGLMDPDSGNAYIGGLDVINHMDNVRNVLGVCNQFDILWDELTASEHFNIYGMIKGLTGSDLVREKQKFLKWVALLDMADRQVKTFSGGMKRRLSVALAFVGNPKLIFLDEPTTGMDPVIRRQIWDMILSNHEDRVIVLTTHAMEEADFLASRIAIMARGKMIIQSSPMSLKRSHSGNRFDLYTDETNFTSFKPHLEKIFSSPYTVEEKTTDIFTAFESYTGKTKIDFIENPFEGHYTFTLPPGIPFHILNELISLLENFDGHLQFDIGQSSLEDAFININMSL